MTISFRDGPPVCSAKANQPIVLARAVPAEALDAAVEAEVAPYLDCAPGAVAAAKKLAQDLGSGITDATIEASIAALVQQWAGKEAPEGISAFFERRKPGWARG